MAQLLEETLDRIRDDTLGQTSWRSLLLCLGIPGLSPDSLRPLHTYAWLESRETTENLLTLATEKILHGEVTSSGAHENLIDGYSNNTRTPRQTAVEKVNGLVDILVGGYFGAIPPDQKPALALVQEGFRSSRGTTTRALERVHTSDADRQLDAIVLLGRFRPEESREQVQELLTRVTAGDLSAASHVVAQKTRYWAARLCATDDGTLDVAKRVRRALYDSPPALDLSILDALIAEREGRIQDAIDILRDIQTPDARSVLLGMFRRTDSPERALSWFDQTTDGGARECLTDHGWCTWAICMAETGRWEEGGGATQ